jgi:hypothetical protein
VRAFSRVYSCSMPNLQEKQKNTARAGVNRARSQQWGVLETGVGQPVEAAGARSPASSGEADLANSRG